MDSVTPSLFSILSKSYVTHNFNAVCRKAGLTDFKLHSLRHTFATRMIDNGVDVLTLSKILGHSDIKTTMIYAKVRVEAMKNAVMQLEKRQLPVRKWYIEGGEDRVDDEQKHKIV